MLYQDKDAKHISPLLVTELTLGLTIQHMEDAVRDGRPEPETLEIYQNMMKLRAMQSTIEEMDEGIFKILNNTPDLLRVCLEHSRAMMHHADKMAGRV